MCSQLKMAYFDSFSAEEIKSSPSESPLMKKKDSLKEQDEIKAAMDNRIGADDRSPATEVAAPPRRAAAEERMVSFNLGDVEEVPERERLPRTEMKETSIDSGELGKSCRHYHLSDCGVYCTLIVLL